MIRCASILCISLFACNTAAADRTQPLPTTDPQSQGFSPARLERVTSYVQSAIDQGQYAGAVTLVARRGRIVQLQALGNRDVAGSSPMRPDSIFQIYSMTKPITSVAALLLMEEGRLLLDDPVSRFIPQFASMQVLEGENAPPPSCDLQHDPSLCGICSRTPQDSQRVRTSKVPRSIGCSTQTWTSRRASRPLRSP